jgi:hypothetical protein
LGRILGGISGRVWEKSFAVLWYMTNYKRGMEGRKCRCMYIYVNRKAAIQVHY